MLSKYCLTQSIIRTSILSLWRTNQRGCYLIFLVKKEKETGLNPHHFISQRQVGMSDYLLIIQRFQGVRGLVKFHLYIRSWRFQSMHDLQSKTFIRKPPQRRSKHKKNVKRTLLARKVTRLLRKVELPVVLQTPLCHSYESRPQVHRVVCLERGTSQSKIIACLEKICKGKKKFIKQVSNKKKKKKLHLVLLMPNWDRKNVHASI